MKNTFKPNSRFSILTEEISNVNSKNKLSKNDKLNSINSKNSFKGIHKEKETENNKNLKSKEFIFFSEENFPTLGTGITNNIENSSSIKNSYSNMLKKENIIKKAEKNDDIIIKPGTIKLKFNRKLRKIERTTYTNDYQMSDYEKYQEEGYAVLDCLVNLHERRTNEYINNWGYDEWEKLFRFPNYDYYYYDRLDELYEEELEKELQKQEELNKIEDELYDYEDYIYNYE